MFIVSTKCKLVNNNLHINNTKTTNLQINQLFCINRMQNLQLCIIYMQMNANELWSNYCINIYFCYIIRYSIIIMQIIVLCLCKVTIWTEMIQLEF